MKKTKTIEIIRQLGYEVQLWFLDIFDEIRKKTATILNRKIANGDSDMH